MGLVGTTQPAIGVDDRIDRAGARATERRDFDRVRLTNAARLAASLGDETDGWAGQKIILETEQVPCAVSS
jgi:hypothetical protein